MARQLRGDERGASFVVTAIALTVLMGFSGLAVDLVMWQVAKRDMQGVADQAALAAATAFRNAEETGALGDSPTAQNAAYATAIQSGYPASTVTLTPYNSPVGGACTAHGCLQVTITQPQQRYFTGMFLTSNVNVSVSAVGTCNGCANGTFTVTSNGGSPCVMALNPGGNGIGTITASGNPVLSLTKCNLYNNSSNTSATILNGGAVIEGCSATNACGSRAFLAQSDVPSGSIDIPIVTNASPAPDPYANLVAPTVASGSCNGAGALPKLSSTSTPGGTYCAPANNAAVVLTPGVYNIIGGFDLAGSSGTNITGAGVTFYIKGGGTINGNSSLGIQAPLTGPYAGVALWYGDNSAVTYDGTNTAAFQGAIYDPTGTVTYGGTNATGATCTRLIAASIDLHGTPNGSFDNSGCPTVAGPVLTQSGVTGGTLYSGAPMLIQ